MVRIAWIVLVLAGCSQGGDGKASPAEVPSKAAASTPSVPAAPVTAPAADTGFCEYTVDGGEANRGGGGIMNVQSKHWMKDGKSYAAALLINCGSGKQINLSANGESMLLGPATYKIVRTGEDKTAFSVLGPDFMGGDGEIVLTAFDASHVAGSFNFESGGKRYKGTFDLKCPQPGNGVCL